MKPFGELGRLILWRWSEDFVAAMLFLHFGSGTAAMQYGSGAPFYLGCEPRPGSYLLYAGNSETLGGGSFCVWLLAPGSNA